MTKPMRQRCLQFYETFHFENQRNYSIVLSAEIGSSNFN